MTSRKKKPATRTSEKTNLDARCMQTGDVVSLMWRDTHSLDRVPFTDLKALEEPEPTWCVGVVLKTTENYIHIANEIGDREGDGCYVEQLPLGMIAGCFLLDHIELEL